MRLSTAVPRRSIALLLIGALVAAGIAGPAAALGDDTTALDGGPDTVTVSGVSPGETVEVREDETGVLVQQAVADDDGTVTIDVSHLDAGTYYVEDADDERLTTFTVAGDGESTDGDRDESATDDGDGSREASDGDDGGDGATDDGAGDDGDTSGDAVLRVSGVSPGETVEVREVGSDVLVAQVVADGGGTVTVDLAALDDGMYYVESEDGERLRTFTVAGDDGSTESPGDGNTGATGDGERADGEPNRHGDTPLDGGVWSLVADLFGLFG